MDAGEQLAREIIDALRSGRDVWVVERARELLLEKRAACSDPDDAAFLDSIIRGLEDSQPPGD